MRRANQALLVGLALLAGCSGVHSPADDGKLHILCSFYPMYLFTKNVVGTTEGITVELLVPPELGCPHDYDLSPADAKRIAAAEVYIMNGAGLESFGVDEIKKNNGKIRVVDTSEGVELLAHHHDHDHHHAHDDKHDHDHAHEDDHGHDHDHHQGHSHPGGGNPHFFSSPGHAAKQVLLIGEALAKLDAKHADTYRQNAASYSDKLSAIADQFKEASKSFTRSEIVTMHEVFDYIAQDFGLKVVATIHPVAGQDPSPAEVRQVIEKIKETKAAAVFTEPQYPSKIGETIAAEAGVPVAVLDPIASGPADAPLDYYEKVMTTNLDTLKKYLGGEKKE